MAIPGRLDKLQEEIQNIQQELLPVSRGAVFIKDPRKRRKCPLCRQNLFLYYINYEEMFLMCENSSCDFPFGYEALQVVRNESELEENPVKASKQFFEYPTPGTNGLPRSIDSIVGAKTATMSSLSCISDCDRLSQIGDGDELTLDKQEILATRLTRQDIKRRKQEKISKEVQHSLNRIKELTKEMNDLVEESPGDRKIIKNQKWLNNLKIWEEETGKKMLTDIENVQLGKSDPKLYGNELAISISPSDVTGQSLSVKIEILSKVKDENKQKPIVENTDQ